MTNPKKKKVEKKEKKVEKKKKKEKKKSNAFIFRIRKAFIDGKLTSLATVKSVVLNSALQIIVCSSGFFF